MNSVEVCYTVGRRPLTFSWFSMQATECLYSVKWSYPSGNIQQSEKGIRLTTVLNFILGKTFSVKPRL